MHKRQIDIQKYISKLFSVLKVRLNKLLFWDECYVNLSTVTNDNKKSAMQTDKSPSTAHELVMKSMK